MQTNRWMAMAEVHKNELMLEKMVSDAWNWQRIFDPTESIVLRSVYHMIPIKFPTAVRKSATLRQTSSFLPVLLSSRKRMKVRTSRQQPTIDKNEAMIVR